MPPSPGTVPTGRGRQDLQGRVMFIVGVLFLIVATVFVLENRELVTVTFLGWSYAVSLGVALLVAAVGGAVIIYFSSIIKQAQLRGQVRSAEARVRDLERERRQQQPPVAQRADEEEDVRT